MEARKEREMKRLLFYCSIILFLVTISQHVFPQPTAVYYSNTSTTEKYYGKTLCSYPQFLCIKVRSTDSWHVLFPNPRDRSLVMRLNRMNTAVTNRPWIAIPKDLTVINYLQLSPFPLHKDTNGQKLIIINLTKQAFGAYDPNGNLIHWGPVSGGKGYCPDVHRKCTTVTGSFRIESKKGSDCISSKYPVETRGGAKMPYCMFFYKGYALHGSSLPGYNASHGCIRLFNEDAQWLNLNFANVGTRVLVTN